MAKKSSLRVALEQDHHNFGVSEESLGATALLVDDLLDLYDSLGKVVWDTKLKPTDDVALALPLMMKCRLCLVRAATLAMQGHFPECATQTRTAIESCATAKKFHRNPSSANVWLQAELDDRKKVRQEFSTRELFPKGDQRLDRLRQQYDTNSVLTHVSTHSLAQNVKAVREEGGLHLYLSSSGLAFSGFPGGSPDFPWKVAALA
jgi:hypothetical protein